MSSFELMAELMADGSSGRRRVRTLYVEAGAHGSTQIRRYARVRTHVNARSVNGGRNFRDQSVREPPSGERWA